MAQRPPTRISARTLLKIRSRAQELVSPHLKKLYLAVGREVVNTYFADLAEAQTTALLAEPDRIRKMVEKALVQAPPSKFARLQPAQRARIDFLTEFVKIAPPDGIHVADAVNLLAEHLGVRIKPEALRESLRRTTQHHKLTVLAGQVRFKTEAVIELLAERHKARMLQMSGKEKVS